MNDLARVADAAVGAASPYLADRFGDDLDADYSAGDVTTDADREAERLILDIVRERRPDDPISAEESGEHPGSGSIRWVVDPLDGTNNFTVGLPTFGSAVTAVEDGQPRATAVDLPIVGDRYVATPDGCRLDGHRVAVAESDHLPVEQSTVGVVIGSPVIEAIDGPGELDETFRAVVSETRGTAKRVIESWAPVVHYSQCAQGRLDAIVAIRPDERERVAGELVTQAAGCPEREIGPVTVTATHDALADRLERVVTDAIDG
ncbi:inositol monophosphatase family protein [Halococcoides cellulosivorans]|uniref:fructose-bisphosphatase n=1 Tax=Halococcoides cellulosivorans TaxID=1679096 RepID=A0A2R4X0A6_9EURY|nr:inositol monophosphatase family protein [Halococcoides cellulosivorans]AWB27217.1 inositol monophosphatase [Halococcoides cellulosivorans]